MSGSLVQGSKSPKVPAPRVSGLRVSGSQGPESQDAGVPSLRSQGPRSEVLILDYAEHFKAEINIMLQNNSFKRIVSNYYCAPR